MKLSPDQIAQYAAAAGFSGGDLTTAVAIAFAESSGNPQAFNPEGSYGLWQIYLQAHPEFAGVDLTDPATNAAAAFQVYRNAGNRFQPWSTFNSGAYTRYMASAQAGVNTFMQAVQIAPGVTVLPPAQDPGANTSDTALATAAGQITQIPGWVWIAAGVLGLMVVMQD
jgi:hypothetical protein